MSVKFKNPKNGEIFTLVKAFERFCGSQNYCVGCPFNSLPGTWDDCETWTENNIEEAAEIMKLEVVREEEKTDMESKKTTNTKPKICEILEVEVGEEFKIKGWDTVVFQILDDGTFITQPVNVPGSSTALLQAIEHPERVGHLPRWSADEVALARAFLEACCNKEDVFFSRRSNGRLCWGVDSEGMDLSENHLPVCLFPQIKNGEKVYLQDIVGEDREEKDEI